jgi:hypothetical protein
MSMKVTYHGKNTKKIRNSCGLGAKPKVECIKVLLEKVAPFYKDWSFVVFAENV